jgi:hypothetical protein
LFLFYENGIQSRGPIFPFGYILSACDSMQGELWLLSFSFSSKRKKVLSIQKSYLELEQSSIRDFGKL